MNFIVTCARHFENETKEELVRILDEVGKKMLKCSCTGLPGIILFESDVSTKTFLNHIKKRVEEEPWSIRYILRIIPIQKIVKTNVEEIVAKITDFKSIIKENETYRISLKKRNSDISSREIISKVANTINKKVSLEKPVWIIVIEIIGQQTGISLIHNDESISIVKMKRKFSE